MSKRILGGVLWFLAASYGWGFVSAMTGILPAAALPIGILVGAFVVADPLGNVWSLNRRHKTAGADTQRTAPTSALTPEVKA